MAQPLARAMPELVRGDVAPDFDLLSSSGGPVGLSSLRGAPVVLFFYPRDDTPGCTKEACGFRDAFPDFGAVDARVFGVSPDSVDSHVRFKEKYALPFELLSDPEHKVSELYGAWGKKRLYGREYEGVLRSTVVVDADGKVLAVFRNVKPEGHAEEVLKALAEN